MSIEENKRLAEKFIQHISDGNTKGFVDMYHDDGCVWTSGSTLISGTFKKTEIQASASAILEAFPGGLTFTIHGMTAEADRVAVEASSSGIHATGKPYANLYHFLFEFKDGRVLKLKEYMDTEPVTDILCGGQRPA